MLIYDPKISDKEMLRILQERAKAGVEIKVIGQVAGSRSFEVQKLAGMRLHTRTIIRDGRQAFVGSQSLRAAELDSRREVGLIVRDPKAVRKLIDDVRVRLDRGGRQERAGASQKPWTTPAEGAAPARPPRTSRRRWRSSRRN